MMGTWSSGFTPHPVDGQPEGQPPLGYKFEFAYPITRVQRYESIFEFEVIGWERQVDGEGNERFSTRCKILSGRKRWPASMTFKQCDLGHWHDIYAFKDDEAPAYGTPPEVWGYGRGEIAP